MTEEERRIARFTDNLAQEIESALTGKAYDARITTYALDKNSGFMIDLNYHDKHSMEVMVSRRGEEEGKLTIDRFWGVRPIGISTGGRVSSPDELRNAAQIYDEMTRCLNEKFGEPISEHDGRSIYRATLEETVVV